MNRVDILKPLLWLVAVIVIPAVISAYGPEVRRILDIAKGKPRQFWIARLKYRLALLKQLHESPYQLSLHFFWNVAWMAYIAAFYVGLILYFFIWVKPHYATEPLDLTLGLAIASVICSRMLLLRDTFSDLYRYEQVTAELTARIEKLEAVSNGRAKASH